MSAYLDSSSGDLRSRFGEFDSNLANWNLPAALETVRQAREYVSQCLAEMTSIDVDHPALVVSELVTNSVIHAATDVTITLELWQYMIKLVVEDFSSQVPRVSALDVSSETGRGMNLVEKFSDLWGFELTDHGKRVWAGFKYEAD
jgi:anti-sigma regulatory factor (Ser/Thr protein kinase)